MNFLSLPAEVIGMIANRSDQQTCANLISTCTRVHEDTKMSTIPIEVVSSPDFDPQIKTYFVEKGGRVEIFPKPDVASKNLVKTRFDYTNLRLNNGQYTTLSIVFGEPIQVHEDNHSEMWMQFKIQVTGNVNMYTDNDYTHMIPWEDFINERYFIYVSHYHFCKILYGYRGQIHATGMHPDKIFYGYRGQIHTIDMRTLIQDGTCVYRHPTWTPTRIEYSFDKIVLSDLYGNTKQVKIAHTGLIIE